MKTLANIFTPERRQQIQLFFGTLAPIAILVGIATAEQTQNWLVIVGAVLQFIAGIISLVNVRRGDYGLGWAIVRGAIYTFAATVAPALVFFGVFNEEASATLLAGVSLGLSSLSALLSIFIGKQQELDTVVNSEVVGTLSVNADLDKDTYTLDVGENLETLGERKVVTFKVENGQQTPGV